MKYESLNRVYYKNSLDYRRIYFRRANAPFTRHFNFPIQNYNQKGSHMAFLCCTDEFILLADEIYKKHEDLLQMLRDVPPLVLKQFILSSILNEVKATSNIEGFDVTRIEIRDVMRGNAHSAQISNAIHDNVHSAQISKVVAKYNAIVSGERIYFNTCEDVRTFYDEFFCKDVISEKPTYDLDGKLFRKEAINVDSSSNSMLSRGVYPEEKIMQLLSTSLDFLNNENIPLLTKITAFNYLFEYISPFYKGNGMIARFMISYFLAERFHRIISLNVSVNIKNNIRKYYELFRITDSEWNCGDLTPFSLGLIELITEIFDDVICTLIRKIKQLIRYRQRLAGTVQGDELTLEIYDILLQSTIFFGGGISMEDLMKAVGKTRTTIKTRIDSIPAEHITTKVVNENGKKVYKLNLMSMKKLFRAD